MNISYKFIDALKKGGKERQAVIDLLLYIGIVTRPDFTEDDYYTGSLSNWMNEKKTTILACGGTKSTRSCGLCNILSIF